MCKYISSRMKKHTITSNFRSYDYKINSMRCNKVYVTNTYDYYKKADDRLLIYHLNPDNRPKN